MSTMTTQESLLALAKAVYGERVYTGAGCLWIRGEYKFPSPPKNSELFDPANNSEQAMEVLCWLMARDSCNEVCHDTIVFYPRPGRFVTPEHIAHDNTPASLRAAIVQAACRVVQS